jgi:hypothetical protein
MPDDDCSAALRHASGSAAPPAQCPHGTKPTACYRHGYSDPVYVCGNGDPRQQVSYGPTKGQPTRVVS